MMAVYTNIHFVSEGVGGPFMTRRWSNFNGTQNIFISSLNLVLDEK